MATRNFIKIGRVCKVNFGNDFGKHVIILDVVDTNRALVEGPLDQLERQVINFNRLTPTRFQVPICRSVKTGILKKTIEKSGLKLQIESSRASKRIHQAQVRAKLNDFQRFQSVVLRQRLSKAARHHAKVLAKGNVTQKTAPKKK